MGAVLLKQGLCPMGWTAARSCFYCPFGNPSWCHYPRRHHEELCACRQYRVHVDNGGDEHADVRSSHSFL